MVKDSIDYVRASLVLQGYQFDESQIAEIALQFSRIEAIAQSILNLELSAGIEPAPVYRP